MTRKQTLRAVLAALLTVSVLAVVFVARSRGGADAPPRAEDYAGDTNCLSCHQDKRSFLGTAHHGTSSVATEATILGKFGGGENTLATPNPYLHYRMERRADGFYQTAVQGLPPDTQKLSGRFDLVVGSGRKGQSYLHWRGGDRLFQLPVSYWVELRGWITSPGYPEGVVNFERPIAGRCLECHATYFETLPGATNRYDTTSYRLGISCESCHGPGKTHVTRQQSTLARFRGRGIVNPADLSRERKIEGCALCHAGVGEPRTPAFSYRPGEPLGRHVQLPWIGTDEPDVHGNQVALLARSACFQASEMTCTTCHDVHRTQRDAAAFSGKCLTCHQVQSCGLFPEKGHAIARNCVDCHMPELPTNQIVSRIGGESVRPKIRTHWIKVYR